ncbi:MAG: cytochrome-c oxidase, cbb3-type subunit III [Paracoccus sp. (in: a-proteobacteria)]|nr:cytochrome-c oxidase, cbb3-type subunit III [Paracoccus sp. (in: a-proteobacteria)]
MSENDKEKPAMSTSGSDDHDSPANPDNQISLERVAADDAHKADILAHPTGEAEGKNLHAPKRVGPRTGKSRAAKPEVPSTGHSWDGITEYDNPMPRWWLWSFYATIVWGIIYTIFYPAWPLINGATQGILKTNYRKELAAEMQHYDEANAPIRARLMATDLDAIGDDPELASYALNAGRSVFSTWCAQCHGSGAAGARGYPNLLDNVWLWGGTMDDIHYTVTHGIRNTDDPDARYSEMPRFGVDGILDNTQINQVVQHVLAISGQEHNAAQAAEGAVVFADNCVACHGEDGTGDRFQGAPDLTDAVWLYGGDPATIRQSVYDSRFGVMPNWSPRLSEDNIRAVSYYVHSLGGGE